MKPSSAVRRRTAISRVVTANGMAKQPEEIGSDRNSYWACLQCLNRPLDAPPQLTANTPFWS
jgi:hypothetical protein